ncbi:YggT family protein [Candidatus Peregrinibacteria bacterium]|nr:YggT family protein [Candidatus Peregrinibacteria bacterium]
MMSSFANFGAVFTLFFVGLLEFFIFLRVVLSWFPVPRNRFTNFLQNITTPILRKVAMIPFARIGILDLSPIFALFGLQILEFILRIIFLNLGANPSIYTF